MRGIIILVLIKIISLHNVIGYTYETNRCLCQLEDHLNTVRHNLRVGNSYPPTPSPDDSDSDDIDTGSSNSTADKSNANNSTNTTNSSQNSTNTSQNATNTSQNSTNTSQNATNTSQNSTNTTQSTPAPSGKRRKREASPTTTSNNTTSPACNADEKSSDKGVLIPVKENIVSYDQTVRLSVCDGVKYDKNYTASLCNCSIGSTGKLSLCFLNIKYSSDFASPSSASYRDHINRLLPWIDNIFDHSAIKSLYVRTVPIGFVTFGDDALLQVEFSVSLNNRVASPVYDIDSGFQTKEILNGFFKINGFTYETDIENVKGCYQVTDTTPAEPKKKPSLGNMRYIFLGVGIGVAVLVLLFICCGGNDKFYVRFW